MSGTELLDPDGPAGGGRDEEELRVLLRDAVPALASPEDRMDRVLARVDRARRRRRAAGLAAGLTLGLTAAVLAAAPALAPAPGRGADLGPAAAPSSPAVPTPSTPTAEPSASPGTTMLFPLLPGLVVDVPATWHTWIAPSADPRQAFGYLGTQPLGPGPTCPAGADRCSVSGRLLVDGALVSLRVLDDKQLADKITGTPSRLMNTTPDKDCLLLGATRAMTGFRGIDGGSQASAIELTACLRQPSDTTLRQVQHVLDSVRSDPRAVGSPVAPGGSATGVG
ncbi:hypothetical protein ACFQ6N_26115 [Kitasatospora sp. NPDC056446]|uniref:hypothetical protein n=1 Tax=Kitasatospora sp. NPDC056446 TaxID=3345819 RepID=UPI0036CBEF1D